MSCSASMFDTRSPRRALDMDQTDIHWSTNTLTAVTMLDSLAEMEMEDIFDSTSRTAYAHAGENITDYESSYTAHRQQSRELETTCY